MVTFTAVSPYERVMTSLLALVCVILALHGLIPLPGGMLCPSSASSTLGAQSVRDRKRLGRLEDGMRAAHDSAKGLHVGKAVALRR
jgi:hypothetical protein